MSYHYESRHERRERERQLQNQLDNAAIMNRQNAAPTSSPMPYAVIHALEGIKENLGKKRALAEGVNGALIGQFITVIEAFTAYLTQFGEKTGELMAFLEILDARDKHNHEEMVELRESVKAFKASVEQATSADAITSIQKTLEGMSDYLDKAISFLTTQIQAKNPNAELEKEVLLLIKDKLKGAK